jgi:hypothetical protein
MNNELELALIECKRTGILPSSWKYEDAPRKMIRFSGAKDWKGINFMRSIGAKWNPTDMFWQISEAKLTEQVGAYMEKAKTEALEKEAQYRREKIDRYKGYAEESAYNGIWATKSMETLKSLMTPEKYAEFEASIKSTIDQKKKKDQADRDYDFRIPVLVWGSPSKDAIIQRGDNWFIVVSVGKSFRCDENLPSTNSALLGHEGELVNYIYLKKAPQDVIDKMNEEKAKRDEEDRIAKEAIAKAEKERLDRIERIKVEGLLLPHGTPLVTEKATIVWDTFDIYGCGTMLIERNGIEFYFENNGSDGANWSLNNVRTGGAGAIGWMRSMDGVKEHTERFHKFLGFLVSCKSKV